MIYAIRTTSGREDIVIDIMSSNVRTQNLPVKAIVHPAEIKGYVFAEGSSGAIHKAVQGLMHIRGIIEKPINLDEIKHFLELKKDRIRVEEGSVVEIIGGPFRGENGKVTRVDPVKDEVTIELMDASIPIPVTIATEFIKIIKRAVSSDADAAKEEPEDIRVDPMTQTEPEKEEPEAASEEAPAEEKSVFDIDEPETPEEKPAEVPETPKEEPVEEKPTEEPAEKPAEETKEPIEPTEPTEPTAETIPEAPEPEHEPEPEPEVEEPEPEPEPEPAPEPTPEPETEKSVQEEPVQEAPAEGTETEGTEEGTEEAKKKKKEEDDE